VTMAAGVAGLSLLTQSEIDRINQLGERLRARFSNALEEAGIIAQVTGTGSLSQIHFTDVEVSDWRSASTGRVDLRSIASCCSWTGGFLRREDSCSTFQPR